MTGIYVSSSVSIKGGEPRITVGILEADNEDGAKKIAREAVEGKFPLGEGWTLSVAVMEVSKELLSEMLKRAK